MKLIRTIKAKNNTIYKSSINDSNIKILYLYEDMYGGNFPQYIINKAKQTLKQYKIKLEDIQITDTQEYEIKYSYNSELDEDTLQDALGTLYYDLEEIFQRDEQKFNNDEENSEEWGF